MSTHGTIKSCGSLSGLSDPDIIEGEGVRIEVNVPEFLWADDVSEAVEFLESVIRHAKSGIAKLVKHTKKPKKKVKKR